MKYEKFSQWVADPEHFIWIRNRSELAKQTFFSTPLNQIHEFYGGSIIIRISNPVLPTYVQYSNIRLDFPNLRCSKPLFYF